MTCSCNPQWIKPLKDVNSVTAGLVKKEQKSNSLLTYYEYKIAATCKEVMIALIATTRHDSK